MQVKFTSLDEAKNVLIKMGKEAKLENKTIGHWSPYKIFVHCAKTIEYAMTGYPKLKPKLVRVTVGKIAINKFLRQGYMKHNLTADVPSSPVIEDNGSTEEGLKFLIETIDKFNAYKGELKPHLLFGDLSKASYDQYFALHIADHLSELE